MKQLILAFVLAFSVLGFFTDDEQSSMTENTIVLSIQNLTDLPPT